MENLSDHKSVSIEQDSSEEPVTPYSVAISASRTLLLNHTRKIMNARLKVLENPESESLHNFRIAVRKVRSLLAQMDGVLPEPGLSEFKKGFAGFMKKTGTLRDMEVCNSMLSTIDTNYHSISKDQIWPLLDRMNTREKDERTALAHYLESAGFQRFMDDWLEYLDGIKDMENELERSGSPLRLVASESICLRYQKTLKQARKTAKKASMNEIHKMRKSGKKLRYLIESFSELYPDKAVKQVVRDLKKFQDKLGTMQDIEVQSHLISEITGEIGDNLDRDKRGAMEKILKKKEKQKRKLRQKALKLIKKYPEASGKKMDVLFSH